MLFAFYARLFIKSKKIKFLTAFDCIKCLKISLLNPKKGIFTALSSQKR